MPLSILATGGSVYTFNIFVVCAERERVSPRSTARYTRLGLQKCILRASRAWARDFSNRVQIQNL